MAQTACKSLSRAFNAFGADTSAGAACAAFPADAADADTSAEVVEEARASPEPVAGAAHGAGGGGGGGGGAGACCHPPDGGGGGGGGGSGAAVGSHLTTAIAGGCVCPLFSGPTFRWYRFCHGAGLRTALATSSRLSFVKFPQLLQ